MSWSKVDSNLTSNGVIPFIGMGWRESISDEIGIIHKYQKGAWLWMSCSGNDTYFTASKIPKGGGLFHYKKARVYVINPGDNIENDVIAAIQKAGLIMPAVTNGVPAGNGKVYPNLLPATSQPPICKMNQHLKTFVNLGSASFSNMKATPGVMHTVQNKVKKAVFCSCGGPKKSVPLIVSWIKVCKNCGLEAK